MESEQSQNFNERLSQWVAAQGFWFQVRYSISGSGSKGTAMFHVLRLGVRLFIFAAILAVIGWVYLIKHVGSDQFGTAIEEGIGKGLRASEVEMVGFSKLQGQLVVNRLVANGGSETFFNALEARNIRCRMGLLAGVAGKWDTGTVAISSLDLELRAGADDAASAAMISRALFEVSPDVLVNSIEVTDATVRWGYSDSTRGEVANSAMRVQRVGDGMKLTFQGGTFTQNWLRKLEIVELIVACNPNGVTFEKAEFRRGEGSVTLANMKVVGGERPEVSGTARVRKLAIQDALPPALTTFAEGSISGNFTVSGSTNTTEGVAFAGLVRLDGQDEIVLRDTIYLLKALSTVDYVRNYHRVSFRDGSFHLRTGGGGIALTDIDLKAEDVFTLAGNLKARLPTAEEAKLDPDDSRQGTGSDLGLPMFGSQDATSPDSRKDDPGLTLKRAATAARRSKDGGQAGTSLSDRVILNLEARELEAQAAERATRTLRYEGDLRITLLPDAFARAPRLQARFPVDPTTERISLDVPIRGTLYELTFEQGEEILQGRR